MTNICISHLFGLLLHHQTIRDMKNQIETLQNEVANAWKNNDIKLWNTLRSILETLLSGK
jgi:hypothetical protein